jgi:hypothetical protein
MVDDFNWYKQVGPIAGRNTNLNGASLRSCKKPFVRATRSKEEIDAALKERKKARKAKDRAARAILVKDGGETKFSRTLPWEHGVVQGAGKSVSHTVIKPLTWEESLALDGCTMVLDGTLPALPNRLSPAKQQRKARQGGGRAKPNWRAKRFAQECATPLLDQEWWRDIAKDLPAAGGLADEVGCEDEDEGVLPTPAPKAAKPKKAKAKAGKKKERRERGERAAPTQSQSASALMLPAV